MPRKTTYAYVCERCQDLSTDHRLTADATGIEGPYRCRCGCEIRQNDPQYGISRAEYADRFGLAG